MKIFHSLQQVAPSAVAGGTLSIGNFDGVHLGHRQILRQAGDLGRPVVAMTFDPHPIAILSPRQAPPVLTPIGVRAELLGQAGADVVVVVPTDRELLSIEPRDFVERIVVGVFSPRAIVEGPGFGFGRGRRGNVQTLRELGTQFGFQVRTADKVSVVLPGESEPTGVSSTLVRRLISGGALESAAACLGRPYRVVGRLVSGHGRGRGIGFPTANLDPGGQLLPAEGVYAGRAICCDYEGPAAVNIGPAPTFGQEAVSVEAHLLDFVGQLTAERMALDVLARIRGIEKFDSPDALAAQIARDVEAARRIAAD